MRVAPAVTRLAPPATLQPGQSALSALELGTPEYKKAKKAVKNKEAKLRKAEAKKAARDTGGVFPPVPVLPPGAKSRGKGKQAGAPAKQRQPPYPQDEHKNIMKWQREHENCKERCRFFSSTVGCINGEAACGYKHQCFKCGDRGHGMASCGRAGGG